MIGGAICACAIPSWYPKDNPIEQAVEAEIKAETGITIDLTP